MFIVVVVVVVFFCVYGQGYADSGSCCCVHDRAC